MLCVGLWRLNDEQYAALQCVAACCIVLGSMSERFGIWGMQGVVLQCVAVCCSVLQCVAMCCSVLQSVAICCSVLQWVK